MVLGSCRSACGAVDDTDDGGSLQTFSTMSLSLHDNTSPTSVVTIALNNSVPSLSSAYPGTTQISLAFHDDNVEVTLCPQEEHDDDESDDEEDEDDDICPLNTTRSPSTLRMIRALVDEEVTPSPPVLRSSPSLTPSSACCGIARTASLCFSLGANDTNDAKRVQCTIAHLLDQRDDDDDDGAAHQQRGAVLDTTWQSWSYQCLPPTTEDDDETVAYKQKGSTVLDERHQRHVQKVLRNRARQLSQRQHRLGNLRRRIHPFSASSNNNQVDTGNEGKSIAGIPQSRSFQHLRLRSRSTMQHYQKPRPMFGFACSNPVPEHAVVMEDEDTWFKKDTCYDSDPEDFCRRRSRHGKFSSGGDDSDDDDHDKENRPPHVMRPVKAHKCDLSQLNVNDEEEVAMAVAEVMNERWTLVLHQRGQSVPVRAWMERGQCLQNGLIPPRFVWQSGTDDGAAAAATPSPRFLMEQTLRRKTQSQRDDLGGADLLSIHRILPATATSLDHRRYPFAKMANAFELVTADCRLTFEAASHADCVRLQQSLKLIVARFGSKLVVGDNDLDEFFQLHEQPGPGDAPAWLELEAASPNSSVELDVNTVLLL